MRRNYSLHKFRTSTQSRIINLRFCSLCDCCRCLFLFFSIIILRLIVAGVVFFFVFAPSEFFAVNLLRIRGVCVWRQFVSLCRFSADANSIRRRKIQKKISARVDRRLSRSENILAPVFFFCFARFSPSNLFIIQLVQWTVRQTGR